MSIGQLTSIISELYDHDGLQLPSYRHDEVAAIESSIRNYKTGLREILNVQKNGVETAIEKLKAVENELQYFSCESSSDKRDTLEKEINEQRKLLKQGLTPPYVAYVIELSRIQQFKRGLNIYRHVRQQKIIDILLHELLLCVRDNLASGCVLEKDENSSFLRVNAHFLERCSQPEIVMIESLLEALQEYGFEETYRNLPMQVRRIELD